MGLPPPPNYLSWSNNVLKKNCPICLVVIENILFLKFIFYGKMCYSIFLNFGSFMSLNTSLIQLKFFTYNGRQFGNLY